ncbi:hypothetical protein ZIOFF_068299 [Zingiber officinale]|uniref:Uncharacterized protein n=1 Tax=Zingiber officinale TaxID=94328 RepID=A0A8J5CY29_ZINOF|nr:hypothetical protein ZIOFF_068299 [Zingiber officinale]
MKGKANEGAERTLDEICGIALRFLCSIRHCSVLVSPRQILVFKCVLSSCMILERGHNFVILVASSWFSSLPQLFFSFLLELNALLSLLCSFQGLCAGMVTLLIIKWKSSMILSFDKEMFFIFLLPPIIFNAGYFSKLQLAVIKKRAQIRITSSRRASTVPMLANGVDASSIQSDSTMDQESPKHNDFEEDGPSLWTEGTKRKHLVSVSRVPKYSYK